MTPEEIAHWGDKGWGAEGWSTYYFEERCLLARYALQVPEGGLIVEIGTYGGLSTGVLLLAARERKARVLACDPFLWNAEDAERELRKVWEQFPDVEKCFYRMPSASMYKEFPPWEGIHLLHIDGDHGDVATDCRLWLPHLVSGGLVIFHDANPDPRASDQAHAIVRDADLYTGSWETVEHRIAQNCILVRRKP